MLNGKNILLGVCGSIAAYKSASLVRLLTKQGAHVRIVMTESAQNFITPLTLSTLSKNTVYTDYFDKDGENWNNHVELGLWADVLLIAPATANTIAKMAMGLCDNLLMATFLSAKCPVVVAPSMDLDMWSHFTTQNNIRHLKSFDNFIIEPQYGELASGLLGKGRMCEPEDIVHELCAVLGAQQPLFNKKVLVTAGPTYEAIDPVRFIGNFSTGTMGFMLAERFAQLGAEVQLVTGPTFLSSAHSNINITRVTSSQEMLQHCIQHFVHSDITVMSAAVADYKPKTVSPVKIKKEANQWLIDCQKTEDILAHLGSLKLENQFLVGFALETHAEEEYATNKINNKKLDLIVLNSLRDDGAGFGTYTNKITIIDKNFQKTVYPLKTKKEVARDIVEKIMELNKN